MKRRHQKTSSNKKKKFILHLGFIVLLIVVIIITVVSINSQGNSCLDYGEKWPNEKITLITAKIWYVSDFNGYIPRKIIDKLGKKVTPQQRAEVILENNIDYLNVALGNS